MVDFCGETFPTNQMLSKTNAEQLSCCLGEIFNILNLGLPRVPLTALPRWAPGAINIATTKKAASILHTALSNTNRKIAAHI